MTVGTSAERIRVRYGETDMMGHAYYASYLLWLEQARGRWCRDRGFTYKSLEESGYKLPAVELWIKYRGEVKYDQWVVVRAWVPELKRSSVKFQYEIVDEASGAVATEAWSWHVLVGDGMRPVAIPDKIRAMLERDPATVAALD